MNWGHKITIALVISMTFIVVCVYIGVQTKVDLVTEEYYKAELAFEEVIQRKKNTKRLDAAVGFKQKGDLVEFQFPKKVKQGSVHFYKHDDVNKDIEISIKTDTNNLMVVRKDQLFSNGLYQLKVTWEDETYPYYSEQKLFIQ